MLEKAPYDSSGNLMGWPHDQFMGRDANGRPLLKGPEWRINDPFRAALHLFDFSRGRSAAHFNWMDEQDHQYQMFLTDMTDFLKRGTIINGATPVSEWIIVKRGQNYGIHFVK